MKLIEWSISAQKKRTEGFTGPWWELIPEDQREEARAWVLENPPLFKSENG